MQKSLRVDVMLVCRFAMTKLDILDVLDEIKIGIAYRYKGKLLPCFPGKTRAYSG